MDAEGNLIYTTSDPKYEDLRCICFLSPGTMGRHGRIQLVSQGPSGAEWTELNMDDEDDCERERNIFPSAEILYYLLDPNHRDPPEGWRRIPLWGSSVLLVRESIHRRFYQALQRRYHIVHSREDPFDALQEWPWIAEAILRRPASPKEREHQERKN